MPSQLPQSRTAARSAPDPKAAPALHKSAHQNTPAGGTLKAMCADGQARGCSYRLEPREGIPRGSVRIGAIGARGQTRLCPQMHPKRAQWNRHGTATGHPAWLARHPVECRVGKGGISVHVGDVLQRPPDPAVPARRRRRATVRDGCVPLVPFPHIFPRNPL